MIVVRDLFHTYPGTRRQPPRMALRNLNLSVDSGTFCILSGPNGSGKSSLFRILCGLSYPSSGSVTVGGHDLLANPAAIRTITGVVFQSPALDKQLSVQENLKLHADLHGLGKAEYTDRRMDALAWTDLADRLDDRVETLSGGLARQAELAKCLLIRPRILLLDEPTTGLDPASRRSFLQALRQVQKRAGMTVLMTSHVFSDADYADSMAVMHNGHLLAHDSPKALKARIGTAMVVITARDPESFAAVLNSEFGEHPWRYGDELRIDNANPDKAATLISSILGRYSADIISVGVRQPDLEDVFVYITGKGSDVHTRPPALESVS